MTAGRPSKKTPEKLAIIRELAPSVTASEIARVIGVSLVTAIRWAADEMIPLMTRSEALAFSDPDFHRPSGGDGVSDLPPESRERIRQAWIGRKHSAETRRKIGVASTQRKHSDEWRSLMRAKMSGRVIGWSTKISEANRKLDAKAISEIQRRLSCGEKVCVLAADFGVHRTTLSKVKAGTYRGECA